METSDSVLSSGSASSQSAQRSRARVVVSDLHLGEGRRHFDGSLNLDENFTVDTKFVEFLEYFSRAYDEVELVLNGNFMDTLRCRAVEDYPDILFETYAVQIVQTIIEAHPAVFEALRKFLEHPHHRIIYLYGDADIAFYWPKVRQILSAEWKEKVQFIPHAYRRDGVHIEHGHRFEALHAEDLQQPIRKLGEIDVLNLPLGAFRYANFIHPLRKIRPQFYRVRPILHYLLWSFFFETRFFLRIIAQFFRMLRAASQRRLYPGMSFFGLWKLMSRSADSEALESHAEILLASDQVSKVVFGHSHLPSYRQFQNGKEYFNAGTWTKTLSLDLRNLGSFHRLTYVLIELTTDVSVPVRARLMEWYGKHSVIEDFVG